MPPNSKLPMMFFKRGDFSGLHANHVPVPGQGMPNSPPTGAGTFVLSNKGVDGKYSKKSNAVSVPMAGLASFGDSGGRHADGQRERVLDAHGDQLLQHSGSDGG